MTSNIGAKLITDRKTLGFSEKHEDSYSAENETIRKDVMTELKNHFKPEFLNRVDDIIVFGRLSEEDIKQIIELMLKEVKTRINHWIEDIIDSVTLEYSSIQTERVIFCLETDVNGIINDYISDILAFFLKDINIIIKEGEAQSIAIFVISEVLRALKKLELEEI
jgi:hypothetical protein